MAISLSTATTNFLTAVKASLATERSGGSNVNLPPSYNLCRAQDLANVLRLLQTPLSSGTLTATGAGSTTTFVDGASTFVANTQVGNTVTFGAATTTVALRGKTYTIRSNTTTTLTFVETLPAATQTGDTLVINGNFVQYAISELMEGKDPFTSSPAAMTYAKFATAYDALVRLTQQLGGTVPSYNLFTTTAVAGTSTTVITVNTRGTSLRVDEFKGCQITVGSAVRRVISNNENSFTLDAAVTAPSGGEAVTVAESATSVSRASDFYAGGQFQGWNYKLGALITAAQSAVAAFTVPT